ncbi:MAG: hypothetical protein NW223_00750 [Hyphomicrobiaceae bacterium]|nr:hypothetical protein [Hyphomicrobiaceae bacterium]
MRLLPLLLALVLGACTSPEASRIRGGGAGGDTGNRPAVVRMHEGSRPFHGTPRLVFGKPPALDTASQAVGYGQR